MTTVLAVYSLNGCVGRCDATCYGAKLKRCHCICGGRNHGVGAAGVSTQVDHDGIEQFRNGRPELDGTEVVVINRLVIPDAKRARLQAVIKIAQLDLFEEKVA
jgi:hypothetical protein